MSSKLVFYWGSGSPYAWRNQLYLAEKGIEYESKLLSFSNKEHKSPEFLKISERGQIPLLVDGDVVVAESLAIEQYLEERFGVLGPKEGAGRAKVLTRTFSALNHVAQPIHDIIHFVWTNGTAGHKETVIQKYRTLVEELKRWDHYLTESEFFGGTEFSSVDFIIIPALFSLDRSGYDFSSVGLTKIHEYVEKIRKRPSVEATMPPHWKETPNNKKMVDFVAEVNKSQ